MSGSTQVALTPSQVQSLILQGGMVGNRAVSPALAVSQPIGAPRQFANPNFASTISSNIIPNPVGLLRRLLVKVAVTFTVAAGAVLTRGPVGPAAIASGITFTDLNQLTRINCSGKQLMMMNSAKKRLAQGSAILTDTPLGIGSNFNGGAVSGCPASITAAGTYTMYTLYEIPIMYHPNDFRGAIMLSTNQASASLVLTFNPAMFTPQANDQSEAVYGYTGTAPVVTNIVITPYQEYFDQLPTGSDGLPILPLSAMSQIYQVIGSIAAGGSPVPASDFTIPFANLRMFLSRTVEFDNGGVFNPGTDINYLMLQSANLYTLFKRDPILHDWLTREMLKDSMPNGFYYFDFRSQPINTGQFGNSNLVINCSTVNANAAFKVTDEYFSSASTLAGGGSIQSA